MTTQSASDLARDTFRFERTAITDTCLCSILQILISATRREQVEFRFIGAHRHITLSIIIKVTLPKEIRALIKIRLLSFVWEKTAS